MKHLECPIRQTAVTHFLSADAWREMTGPVRNECRNLKLSYSWTTSEKSQAAVIKKKAHFCLTWWATASLELPKDCCVEHWGTSCCQHLIWFFILLITAGSVAHPHCFSLSAPRGFYTVYVCQEGWHLCYCWIFIRSVFVVVVWHVCGCSFYGPVSAPALSIPQFCTVLLEDCFSYSHSWIRLKRCLDWRSGYVWF